MSSWFREVLDRPLDVPVGDVGPRLFAEYARKLQEKGKRRQADIVYREAARVYEKANASETWQAAIQPETATPLARR